VDSRTDIFAAGVVLWEALTQKRLFFAPDPRDTARLVISSPISPPSAVAPGLPPELDRVVLKALARDREQRFASAHDFAEALRKAASEGSRRAVSDWVGRVAKDSLARRLDLLETLEASAIHAQAEAVLPVVTSSSPFHAPLYVSEATGTRATSTRAIGALPEPSPLARKAPVWAAIAGVAAAVIAWAVVLRHPPAPVMLPAPAKKVLAPAAAIDRAEEPSGTASPPPLQVESLPLATASAEPAKPTSSKPRSIVAAEARPRRQNACTPPYRIDASGVRRVKLECL